jgi:EAL domain-containing protein (putative c-di-GMP-specific phosphodiesterase class I)
MRLVDEVASALASSDLPAGSLCLEITESAVMQDIEAAVAAMRDLRRLGVTLALDNFGTGYLSLSYLRRFPLDLVKIDRSYVRELAADGEGDAIVRALIEVCHALDASVIAEGIESPEQLTRLRELGCDVGQGHCFSPPLAEEDVQALIAAGKPLLPAALNG